MARQLIIALLYKNTESSSMLEWGQLGVGLGGGFASHLAYYIRTSQDAKVFSLKILVFF